MDSRGCGEQQNAKYSATQASVKRQWACWRSEEVDALCINQGGTAGLTPVLARGQVFFVVSGDNKP